MAQSISADTILVNCAPATLQRLLGKPYQPPVGSQTKINIVMRRLPRFRSGIEPAIGFAGTLHLGQGYARLQEAYEDALAGQIPDPMPCEVYCHTLTDGSILDPELRAAGYHTLTLFGMHTPASLFTADPAGSRERAKDAALRSLRTVLAEPLEPCLALDRRGEPCIEVMTPLDIEAELGMPGGHIFHGDLAWPWLADDARLRPRPSGGGWQPAIPASCCAAPGRYEAARSAASVGTTPQWPYLKMRDPDTVAPRAPLAQLAEQLTLNQRVGGSIPSRRTFLLVRGTLVLEAGFSPTLYPQLSR